MKRLSPISFNVLSSLMAFVGERYNQSSEDIGRQLQ